VNHIVFRDHADFRDRDYTFLGSFLGAATLGQCHSSVNVGQTISGKYTNSGSNNWAETHAVIISTGVSVVGVHINGYVFDGTPSTAPPSVPATTTATSSMKTAPAATSSAAAQMGLSSGAKIGIGVGVSLGFIAVCCFLVSFIVWRRRSRSVAYPVGFAEAPSCREIYPMAKRSEASNLLHEAPGEMYDKAGSKSAPVEMWVAPHQGG